MNHYFIPDPAVEFFNTIGGNVSLAIPMSQDIESAGRCLGGGMLAGEKLVRLVYIDEAGISNREQEPFLCVGAVIVHADSLLIPLEYHLKSLVKKHIPEEFQSDFVFTAKHIFNYGGKVFTKNNPDWPLPKKILVANDLADIPRRVNLPLVAGICERAKFAQTNPAASLISGHDLIVAAHAATFFRCAINIERWMREHAPNEVCMLILENNEDAKKLISSICVYENEGNVKTLLSEEERKFYPFRHIKEEPAFQKKRAGSILQLADFWVYIIKRMHMDPNHPIYRPRFEMMKSQIWDPSMAETLS